MHSSEFAFCHVIFFWLNSMHILLYNIMNKFLCFSSSFSKKKLDLKNKKNEIYLKSGGY